MSMEEQVGRLARYLDEAWAVEKALVTMLDKLAASTSDPVVKELFLEHRRSTRTQEVRLEERIRDLGKQPSVTKGFFNTMLARMTEAIGPSHDELDKVTQDLMLQYAIENFEAAMYEALRTYADAIGDHETVRLAELHLADEQQTAHRIWNLIEATAARPAAGHPIESVATTHAHPDPDSEKDAAI
jgi:ferritin-like metal-binding protein YciE